MNEILEKIKAKKDDNITLLDAMTAVVEEENLDIKKVAMIVRRNKKFLAELKDECCDLNMLKV